MQRATVHHNNYKALTQEYGQTQILLPSLSLPSRYVPCPEALLVVTVPERSPPKMEYQSKMEEGGCGGNRSLSPVFAGSPALPDAPVVHESDYTSPCGRPEQYAGPSSLFTQNPVPGPNTYATIRSLQHPQNSSQSPNQYTHTPYSYFPNYPGTLAIQKYLQNSDNHTAGYPQAAPGFSAQAHQQTAFAPQEYSPHHPAFASEILQNQQNSHNHTAGYSQAAPDFFTQTHQQTVFAPQGYSPHHPTFAFVSQQNLRNPHNHTARSSQAAPGYSAQAHRQTIAASQGYSPGHPSLIFQQNVPQSNTNTTVHPAVPPCQPSNFAHQSIPPYYSGCAAELGAQFQEPEKRSVKHLTCYYWIGGHCKWTEDECTHAHMWTGKVADKPMVVGSERSAVPGRNLREQFRILSGQALKSQTSWTQTSPAAEATPASHMASSPMAISPAAISAMATFPMAPSPMAISPVATSPMTNLPMLSLSSKPSASIPTSPTAYPATRFSAYEAALKTQASLLRQSTTGFSTANATLIDQATAIETVARTLDTNSEGNFSDLAIRLFAAAAKLAAAAEKGKEIVDEVEGGGEMVRHALNDAGIQVDL